MNKNFNYVDLIKENEFLVDTKYNLFENNFSFLKKTSYKFSIYNFMKKDQLVYNYHSNSRLNIENENNFSNILKKVDKEISLINKIEKNIYSKIKKLNKKEVSNFYFYSNINNKRYVDFGEIDFYNKDNFNLLPFNFYFNNLLINISIFFESEKLISNITIYKEDIRKVLINKKISFNCREIFKNKNVIIDKTTKLIQDTLKAEKLKWLLENKFNDYRNLFVSFLINKSIFEVLLSKEINLNEFNKFVLNENFDRKNIEKDLNNKNKIKYKKYMIIYSKKENKVIIFNGET